MKQKNKQSPTRHVGVLKKEYSTIEGQIRQTLNIPMSNNITEKELHELEKCQSENDWNIICNNIKAVRGGVYPSDWWEKVELSGRSSRISSRWLPVTKK